MHYLSKPTWQIHPVLVSSHQIICGRCRTSATEAGVIEAYTVSGELHIAICADCLGDFISFTTKGETVEKDMSEFSVEALASALDIDIAEHHATCQCYECLVDPDAYYKAQREDHINISYQQEKSA